LDRGLLHTSDGAFEVATQNAAVSRFAAPSIPRACSLSAVRSFDAIWSRVNLTNTFGS